MKKRRYIKSKKGRSKDFDRNSREAEKMNRIEHLVSDYFKHVETEGLDKSEENFREEEILTSLKTRLAKSKRKSYRSAIAASFIGFVALSSLAIWFYLSSVSQDTVVLTADSATIEPGGNRASLTLADGTILDLSEHLNGQIANQDGSIISKPADGMLVYNISDNDPSHNGSSEDIVFNSISTPSGGQFAVVLPDGSKVWLNAESVLKYPTSFKGDNRMVELIGEGYFEIKRNENKPFTIKSNDQIVTVLGTKFNINSYPDEQYMHTTLVEGSVQIEYGQQAIVLKPGEQATVKDGIEVNKIDLLAATAWKNGDFIFKNDGLRTIMKQIERWYNVEIEYEGDVEDLRFGGIVSRSQNLSTVLKMLEKTGRVKFELIVETQETNEKKPRVKVIKI